MKKRELTRNNRTLLGLVFVLAAFSPATAQPRHQLDPEEATAAGVVLLRNCRIGEARALFERVLADAPEHAGATFGLGQSFLARNDFDAAIELILRSTELDPDNADYQFALGEAHGRKARDAGILAQISLARRAREGFEAAVELDAGHLVARRNLVEFYSRAPAIMGGGKDKAEAQVVAIAERNVALGHEARALFYRLNGRGEQALDEYRLAIDAAPELAMPRFELASFHLEQKRFGEAAKVLIELLSIAPEHKLALYRLGKTAAQGEVELEKGEAALERYIGMAACQEDPPHPDALLHLGRVREHLGDRKGALAAYRQAVEESPGDKGPRRALKQAKTRKKG